VDDGFFGSELLEQRGEVGLILIVGCDIGIIVDVFVPIVRVNRHLDESENIERVGGKFLDR